MGERIPQITKSPVAIPSAVHFEFLITHTHAGLPPLELRGKEWDVFRDCKLAMHYEVMHNLIEVGDYLSEHASLLISVAEGHHTSSRRLHLPKPSSRAVHFF